MIRKLRRKYSLWLPKVKFPTPNKYFDMQMHYNNISILLLQPNPYC